jgi:hypothetical protein
MKILLGDKGNIDFDAPVPMTKEQQDSFIELMKSLFDPDVVKIMKTNKFRVDRIGDHLFQREWTAGEIAKLLDVHSDTEEVSEKLGRTWMSVVIKRGEVIPDLIKWTNIKGYDLAKGDIRKIIEEYLQERKDLAKEKRTSKSAERKKINDLVAEYNNGLTLLKTIDFRSNAGFRQPTDDETVRKTKARMETIESELSEKYNTTLESS